MRYDLYCAELEEYTMENVKWKKIKEFGFDIIKDRSNSPYAEKDDELTIELSKIVKKGIKKMDDEYVIDFLKEWGYEVIKVS